MRFFGESKCYILIEESFITDLMPQAPGDFIKVYLYSIKCFQKNENPTFSNLCSELKMSQDLVLRSFEYWQDIGLMKIHNGEDFSVEILTREPKKSQHLFTHREFNATLKKIFGSRLLTPSEYNSIYDYTDILNLPQEVVALLLEYCVKLKGPKVSVSYIDKVAQTWVAEGVVDIDSAIAKLNGSDAKNHNATKVLRHLGVNTRSATESEIALYNKWENELGFSLNSILQACSQTTSTANPSFKYLDSILTALYKNKKITPNEVRTQIARETTSRELIKEIQKILGLKSNITLSDERYYQSWRDAGYSHEMILLAADKASKHVGKFIYIDKIIAEWKSYNIYTPAEVEKLAALDQKIKECFNLAGIKKPLAEFDRNNYLKWTAKDGFSHSIILKACEISTAAKNPYQYLCAVLEQWKKRGVKTLDQAKDAAKTLNTAQNKNVIHFNQSSINYEKLNDSVLKDPDEVDEI